MGLAKYHEDNIEIYDERMYYRQSASLPCVQSNYSSPPKQQNIISYCPLCHQGFGNSKTLIPHILSNHGGLHDIVFLNNVQIKNNECTVSQIKSLILYSFRDEPIKIKLYDNIGNEYSLQTKRGTYEYNLKNLLNANIYSELSIENIDSPVRIKLNLNISNITIKKYCLVNTPLCYLMNRSQKKTSLLTNI